MVINNVHTIKCLSKINVNSFAQKDQKAKYNGSVNGIFSVTVDNGPDGK